MLLLLLRYALAVESFVVPGLSLFLVLLVLSVREPT